MWLYIDKDKIKSDLAKNYFEFTGIAKSFEGSNLEKLPNEMIVEIASYLKIKDINIAAPESIQKIEINHYSNINETTSELIEDFSE